MCPKRSWGLRWRHGRDEGGGRVGAAHGGFGPAGSRARVRCGAQVRADPCRLLHRASRGVVLARSVRVPRTGCEVWPTTVGGGFREGRGGRGSPLARPTKDLPTTDQNRSVGSAGMTAARGRPVALCPIRHACFRRHTRLKHLTTGRPGGAAISSEAARSESGGWVCCGCKRGRNARHRTVCAMWVRRSALLLCARGRAGNPIEWERPDPLSPLGSWVHTPASTRAMTNPFCPARAVPAHTSRAVSAESNVMVLMWFIVSSVFSRPRRSASGRPGIPPPPRRPGPTRRAPARHPGSGHTCPPPRPGNGRPRAVRSIWGGAAVFCQGQDTQSLSLCGSALVRGQVLLAARKLLPREILLLLLTRLNGHYPVSSARISLRPWGNG